MALEYQNPLVIWTEIEHEETGTATTDADGAARRASIRRNLPSVGKASGQISVSIQMRLQTMEIHHFRSSIHRKLQNGLPILARRDEIVINFEHHDDGIRRHKVPPPLKFKLNRSVDGRGLEISPPLNGLVCVYSRKVRHAFILNIKTRQIINLPEISEDCGTVTLCCDKLTGEYKVLQFYRTFDPAPRLESAIYTLNGLDSDSSWRKTGDPPQLNNLDSSASRPCVNGTVYWLIVGINTTYLICFDVCAEVFRTLRFTETPTYNANVLVVGSEWSACFPIICPHFVANGFVPTEIWVLEECWGFNEVSIKEKIPLPRDFTLESPWRHVYSGELPTGELFIVDSRTTRKFYVDLKKKRYEIKWSYPRQGKYLSPYSHKVLIGYVENMYRFEDHDNGRHRVNSFLRED
ncbi:OLC1v1017319C1 [Oldenlandia corymbosa var. corymbosa]|uniref:OLC1v1017319C1 n=1 Tax=Oldenlandia corymbosa var. corymbosa TaxID=529605 RepID=A0AAV1E952_OLDCO|nr:OLC1v1017319C1 [Oldenlandia corymbosa var. corymbosa]